MNSTSCANAMPFLHDAIIALSAAESTIPEDTLAGFRHYSTEIKRRFYRLGKILDRIQTQSHFK